MDLTQQWRQLVSTKTVALNLANMTGNFVKADSRNLPNLDNGALMEYIASNSNHNLAEIRVAKILMSSRDSYLDSAVGYVQVCREGSECKVKARVVPEHRVNNKSYTVACKMNEADDVVMDSSCEDCAASAGGCKHSLLLLFWLVKKSSEPASTSTECYWTKPTLSTARTAHVLSKDIFPKAKKPKLAPKDASILAEFYEECEKRQIKNNWLIIKYNTEMARELNMNIFNLALTFMEKDVTHDFSNFKVFLQEIVDYNIIKTVNEKTVGQNNCKYWHNIRQGKLTASKLYEAAHCKTDGSLVQQILGGYKVPETKQIQRGRNLEVRVLKEIEAKLGTNIQQSGFVLINGILGAFPDGITDNFVVEIKCPATQKAVNTYVKNGIIQNKFKAQIQCQMLACGMKKGVFCVADPEFEATKNITLFWEDLDVDYINDIITRAEHFWESYIFPKLIKSAQD